MSENLIELKNICKSFGDEEVLTVADVNKMTQDRQIILAEIEKRFNERKNNKEPKTAEVPEGSFVF